MHDIGFLKITLLDGHLYGVPINILSQGTRTLLAGSADGTPVARLGVQPLVATLSSWWLRIVVGALLLVFILLQRFFLRRK